MDTLQRSDTVLLQTVTATLYQLNQKLSFYKIGVCSLLFFVVVIGVIIVVLVVSYLQDN